VLVGEGERLDLQAVGVAEQAIENQFQKVLGVVLHVLHESHSRIREGHAAENLAVLRRPALNLPREQRTKPGDLKGKRLRAGWNNAILLPVLLQIRMP
jgi:hypothetical protein